MINKKLIQYCKDNDFPIEEMNDKDFKVIENSFEYKGYLLNLASMEFYREIAKVFKRPAMYIANKINLHKR